MLSRRPSPIWQTRLVTAAENLTPARAAALEVVVTHYRTPELLEQCLARLAAELPGVPVTVVDADSGDGTVAWLRRDHPWVTALATRNHSMAGAVNAGLKRTCRPYVLQMNADVFLEPGTVPQLLAALEPAGVGMVGPRCRTPAGRWQDQGLLYRRHHLRAARAGRAEVGWLSGCCTLVKREALQAVGGLDSSLRFYNEDIDWCHRLRAAGYACVLVNAPVTHVGGASTPREPRFVLEGLRGGMQLSRRFRPPPYRALHRFAVLAYARLARPFAAPEKRRFLEMLERLFAERRFDESPFGATLGEDNPRFGA